MIVEYERDAGEPTMAGAILRDVLDVTPEMCWGGREEAVKRCLEATEAIDRYEVVAYHDNRIVGCMILVGESDSNVGPCLGVMWNFVLPEFRGALGRSFLRKAYALAKENGLPVLAFTQRIGLGEYLVKYRRVPGGKEDHKSNHEGEEAHGEV